jgi:hypothetical protein
MLENKNIFQEVRKSMQLVIGRDKLVTPIAYDTPYRERVTFQAVNTLKLPNLGELTDGGFYYLDRFGGPVITLEAANAVLCAFDDMGKIIKIGNIDIKEDTTNA